MHQQTHHLKNKCNQETIKTFLNRGIALLNTKHEKNFLRAIALPNMSVAYQSLIFLFYKPFVHN